MDVIRSFERYHIKYLYSNQCQKIVEIIFIYDVAITTEAFESKFENRLLHPLVHTFYNSFININHIEKVTVKENVFESIVKIY